MSELKFEVQGMTCGGCEASAKRVVMQIPGVVDAEFSAPNKSGVVKGSVAPAQVVEALRRVGYTATLKS